VHPNIVQTFEFGEAEGTYFIAMEGVQGVTLRELLTRLKKDQRTIPFMIVADIAKQICTGLDYAHSLRGADGAPLEIVHQDVSPTNIMLAFNGTVKILDFGIARAASFAEEEAKKGLIKGKVAYLAPEQVNMQPFDHRIDVFALGIVMHEMMTGQRLFQAKNDIAKMRQLLAQPIPPPSAFNATVPRELDRIVMKALEVDPAQRYQSTTEMASDLERTMIAARHSSRDLSKLLRGLYLDEGEDPVAAVVVEEGVPVPQSGPATGSMSSVRSTTQELSQPERTRSAYTNVSQGGALGGALRAEQSRLVQERRRGQAKIALVVVALAVFVGVGTKLWPHVAPLVHDLLASAPPPPPPPAAPAPVAAAAPVVEPVKPAPRRRAGKKGEKAIDKDKLVAPRTGEADDVLAPSE
jgi:serine/threonine protein kinase